MSKHRVKAASDAKANGPLSRQTRSARKPNWLERSAYQSTRWTGSSWALAAAVILILAWLVTGPIFEFSDTWQLVINTGTTMVTFLMVFLIQRTQNKESLVLQLKLNEIVAALEGASNGLINVEDLSEDEVRLLHEHYARLVELARKDGDLQTSHSIEDAEGRHQARRASADPAERSRYLHGCWHSMCKTHSFV